MISVICKSIIMVLSISKLVKFVLPTGPLLGIRQTNSCIKFLNRKMLERLQNIFNATILTNDKFIHQRALLRKSLLKAGAYSSLKKWPAIINGRIIQSTSDICNTRAHDIKLD